MQKQSFMRADEVAQELGISKSHAYKVIHGLNEELQEKGFTDIQRIYFGKEQGSDWVKDNGDDFRR